MEEKRFYNKTLKNVLSIFKFLKSQEKNEKGFLTISKISKETGLHKWVVSRTIDLYMPYVEVVIPDHLEDVGLQLKLIRLKDPKITEQQVIRHLEISKFIK